MDETTFSDAEVTALLDALKRAVRLSRRARAVA